MPIRKRPQNPKNKSWIQLTQDFVKEWPDVLEGLSFQSMPIKYVKNINIILKNKATLKLDIEQELKTKRQKAIADWLKKYIEANYKNIQTVDLKFDVARLRSDMESKTAKILDKTFKKN
jgi:hypothetical protein